MNKSYKCMLCSFIYHETDGRPEDGFPAGTEWENIPDTWECPECDHVKRHGLYTEIPEIL